MKKLGRIHMLSPHDRGVMSPDPDICRNSGTRINGCWCTRTPPVEGSGQVYRKRSVDIRKSILRGPTANACDESHWDDRLAAVNMSRQAPRSPDFHQHVR